MSFRTTIILFAVVVLLVAVLLVNTLVNTEKPSAGGIVEPLTEVGQKASQVETIELERTEPNEQKLVFAKANNRWMLREPFAAKVDSAILDRVVNGLFAARPVSHPILGSNLTVLGLDRPTLRVTLRGKDNAAVTINLGDTTVGTRPVTFLTTSDRKDIPVAVAHVDVEPLFRPDTPNHNGPAAKSARWLTDYRLRKLIGFDLENLVTGVRTIKLNSGSRAVELTADKQGDWTFVTPADFGPADTLGDSSPRPDTFTGVRPILNSLASLQAAGNQDYIENPIPADVAKYGLADGDPKRIRIELQSTTPAAPAEVIYLGKPVELDGKPASPPQIYCRLEGDAAVVKVPYDRLVALAGVIENPSQLRNRDLLPSLAKERIDAIDVRIAGQDAKLRKLGGPGDTWAVYGKPDAQPAASLQVRNLLDALTRPRIARDVVAATNDEPFQTPVAELKVWQEGLGATPPAKTPDGKFPAEPTLTGQAIEFTIGRSDADATYLRRVSNGVKTVYLVPTDRLVALMRNRLEYLDSSIPSFNVAIANRLAFNRGNEQIVLLKDTKADPAFPNGKWTFELPANRKGRIANAAVVSDLLTLLATTQATKVVAETPTPEESKIWGLAPPRVKVMVSLTSDTEKQRSYEIGLDTDEKKAVFFHAVGKPYVYLVSSFLDSELAGVELRDTTLFRIDPAKVEQLDLLGWKGNEPGAMPKKVRLRREKGVWVAAEPADFPVDSAKIDQFVKRLESPRIDKYLHPLPPETGTREGEGLQVVITAQDGVRLLKLGKEDETKKGVYAIASTLGPGEMVLIPADIFLPYVTTTASLTK